MLRALALVLALAALAACGPGRTSAATQPTPAEFDPAQSEPDALALVDAALTKLGGYETWDAVKQLTFTMKYSLDGEIKAWSVHHWDRWNGRHNFQSADLSTDDGRPDSLKWMEVFYDLFNTDGRAHASYDGNEVAREDADKFRKQARTALAADVYMMTIMYKLRDPGVKLKIAGEIPATDDACDPACKTVEVTFDPEVGKDIWYVNYNTASGLPEILERKGSSGRIGFRIQGWTEADGLKFPSGLQNLGLPGEVFEFSEIAIGSPDDRLYIPQVTGD